MNYELAKELRDAGFPQKGNTIITPTQTEICVGYYDACYCSRCTEGMWGENHKDDMWAVKPTLEELIEVCGEGIGTFKISNKEATAWKKDWPTNDPDDVPLIYTGSTLIVAVARLWLALNKK